MLIRIGSARPGQVVVLEVAPEASDLDADDRVALRVEPLVAAEDRQGQVELVEAAGTPGQRPVDDMGSSLRRRWLAWKAAAPSSRAM